MACSMDDELGPAAHFENSCIEKNADACRPTFFLQHGDDFAGGAIAEKLAQRLLVVTDAVLLDERNEIRRRVAGQRGLGEVRIGRNKILRRAVNISEIASAAARDQNLLAQAVGVLEHGCAAAALAGLDGAHQAGSPASENYCVKGMLHEITCRTGSGGVIRIFPADAYAHIASAVDRSARQTSYADKEQARGQLRHGSQRPLHHESR